MAPSSSMRRSILCSSLVAVWLSGIVAPSALALDEFAEEFLGSEQSLDLSAYEALAHRPSNIEAGEEFMGTPTVSVPTEYLRASIGVAPSRWQLRLGGRVDRVNPLGETITRPRLGAAYRTDHLRASLDLGHRYGYRGFRRYAKAEIQTDFLGARTSWLSADLASPLLATPDLARLGVSESRLVVHWEKRMDEWTELVFQLTGRLTHLGKSFGEGSGSELATRMGFGREADHWRFGPWIQLLRWGSKTPKLDPLLAHKSSILGPYGSLILGSPQLGAIRFKLSSGWGKDLVQNPEFNTAFFAESSVESTLTDTLGIKFSYNYYTAQISQGLGAVTHMAEASLVYAF